jgi:hypothetical protein
MQVLVLQPVRLQLVQVSVLQLELLLLLAEEDSACLLA